MHVASPSEFEGSGKEQSLAASMAHAVRAQADLNTAMVQAVSHGVTVPPIRPYPFGGSGTAGQHTGPDVERPQGTRILADGQAPPALAGSSTPGSSVPTGPTGSPRTPARASLEQLQLRLEGVQHRTDRYAASKETVSRAEESASLLDSAREQIDLMRDQAETARGILQALERQRDEARARETAANRQWWAGTIITLISLVVAVVSLAIAFQ